MLLAQGTGSAVDADPVLDEGGLLRYRGAWVAVSPKEELVLRPLLARWRRVVSRADLEREAFPQTVAGEGTLGSLVSRLRKRIQPLGLNIEPIRGRGFLLEAAPRTLSEGLTWRTS